MTPSGTLTFITNFFVILFFAAFASKALAQQTYINVPSPTILERDQNFLQHESQFKTENPNQFYNATNYYARGIGFDTELDVTQFNLSTPASQNVVIGLGTKTSFALDEKSIYKPTIIFGAMVPFSLQGEGAGHWIYSTFNFELPQTKTTFTAGISKGSKQIFGREVTSFIGAFEQKISGKLSVLGDWYSGNHNLGIGAIAFGYYYSKSLVFYGGYQIANQNQKNLNSYVIEIATFF